MRRLRADLIMRDRA